MDEKEARSQAGYDYAQSRQKGRRLACRPVRRSGDRPSRSHSLSGLQRGPYLHAAGSDGLVARGALDAGSFDFRGTVPLRIQVLEQTGRDALHQLAAADEDLRAGLALQRESGQRLSLGHFQPPDQVFELGDDAGRGAEFGDA